jgi:hypothetical protein
VGGRADKGDVRRWTAVEDDHRNAAATLASTGRAVEELVLGLGNDDSFLEPQHELCCTVLGRARLRDFFVR